MLLSNIEVVSGPNSGLSFEPKVPVVSIGRNPDNVLVLVDASIGEHHARLHIGVDAVLLEIDAIGWQTSVLRRGQRILVSERRERVMLQDGDLLELGDANGKTSVGLALHFAPDENVEPQVLATRPMGHWERPQSSTRLSELTATLSDAERTILSATGLEQIYVAVLDAALGAVPRATHASLILREGVVDDGTSEATEDTAFIPVMTRCRNPAGELVPAEDATPIARSVFRKVLKERHSILVADAMTDGLRSESLLGSNIRSTLAVPLWKNEAIIGVFELDNRARPAMFDKTDLDVVSIIAASASLAVSNARLIERLSLIERQLRQENAFWRQRERQKGAGVQVVGTSDAMNALMAQVDKVARTRATVLIEGETGVGKELIAAAVHARSPRSDKLYVAQNCATLPDNLLESELFGHKKGAFTGASEDKKGLFEVADGGTLFLDEVTEIPLALQAKLLRVLLEGEVRAVGSNRLRYVDVRIIAASNRDLEAEIRAGRFREDLYYRLSVFPLRVPPLRERRSDIPLLGDYFLSRYSQEFAKPVAGFAEETLRYLAGYAWPGNVRELQNEVQRLVIQAEPGTKIDAELLSAKIHRPAIAESADDVALGPLKDMLDTVERKLIQDALARHGNNKTATAKALGITREGLHKKLRLLKM